MSEKILARAVPGHEAASDTLTPQASAPVERGDIIQILGHHQWAFCLAVVSEPKSFGCQAYVRIPHNDGEGGNAYIRLNSADYEAVGARAPWMPA